LLLALKPDLVIAAGFERKEFGEALRQSGIRVIDVRIRNFDELFAAIRQIGDAVDKRSPAENLVATMQAELNAVSKGIDALPRRQRPKVFVEIAEQPLITAGGDSFLDELIARAGGINVAHEISQEYVNVSTEKVIEWNPDVIVIARMGRREDAALQVSQRVGWTDISAVKEARIIDDIPPDLLFRPSPRLIEGVKALAVRLRNASPPERERQPPISTR
jgi:iron complex transport system substrate-binding protein